ncbi:MAG: tetratricopeptide repeat protein [Sphingobacteriales bacterium]|nr:tetratricopeptide repeat protein [Sphingobacteriales bacterium]
MKQIFTLLFILYLTNIQLYGQKISSKLATIEKARKEIDNREYKKATATLALLDSNSFKPTELYKGFYYQQLASLAFYDTYEDAKAVNYYYKAIKIYGINQSKDDIGMAYSNLVGILTDLKDYKRAEIAFQKSLPYVKNNKIRYGNALINYARLKLDIGDYAKATALNLEAIKLFEQAGNQARLSAGYFQMGINMETSKQFDKAIEYYQKGLTIRKGLKDSLGMSNIYNNLGIIYKNQKQYKLATQNYKAAYDIALQMKRPVLALSPLINLAVVANRENQQQQAIKLYEEALEIAKKFVRTATIKIIESNLAYIYINNNDFEKALPLAQKAYDYGKEKGSLEEKIAFSSNLAEVLDGLGRTKEAFSYMRDSYDMSDSLHRKQSAEAIAEMLTKFETQKKEQQILLLGKENNIQKLTLNNQDLMLSQRALEISNRDYSINLQKTEIEAQKLKTKEQLQQISLLAKEKEIKNLELKQKNTYLLMAFGVLMIGGFSGFQIYKRRKLDEETRLQNEKLRISRELHDNIGSQLTFISNSIESFEAENGTAVKLNEAQTITKNTIRELRRTVWLINQPEFSLEEFEIKLRDYVKPFETGKPIINIITNDASDCVLKPITATNLFRIIQEGVNNALKYADASLLEVTLNKQNNQLNVLITDNGKGFDLDKNSEGYGLKNIKARVETLKGEYTFSSKPTKGTQINISLPI